MQRGWFFRERAKAHAIRLLLLDNHLDQALALLQEIEDELHSIEGIGIVEVSSK